MEADLPRTLAQLTAQEITTLVEFLHEARAEFVAAHARDTRQLVVPSGSHDQLLSYMLERRSLSHSPATGTPKCIQFSDCLLIKQHTRDYEGGPS